MRICLVSDQYFSRFSGIGLYTNNLVEGLIERGYEVVLVCNEKPMFKVERFEYIYLPPFKWDPTHSHWASFNLRLFRRILNLQESYGFDIFHSLDARQGALGAKRLAIPTVGSVNDYYFAVSSFNPFYFFKEYRNDWWRRYLYNHFTKTFERWMLHYYDALITNSQATGEAIVKAYKLPPRKIHKIYKAIPHFPENKTPIREREDGAYRLLLVGRNLQRKGIYYLIKAAPQIIQEYKNIKFIVVGQIQDRMLYECDRLKLRNNFIFYNMLPPERVHSLYREVDLFILPSLIEGLGVTVIEAMSYGLPIIATHVGGLRDLIEDEKNGLLIAPRSSEAIASSVIRLLSDKALRESISRNNFQSARQFNREKLVEETMQLYQRLKEEGDS
ncbi:MAG: hypothetical protein A3G93_15205 [Nitrospinae bacterium RIFCSPLOWO2_12_FULL_45_22]|nr:MAG: hypothetical protein A3G93_15205 [Nitrospinae bacterium RIFCSPLOWO2_12_FULL_45_22]